MLLYKQLIFLPFNKVPKEPFERETSSEYFLHMSRSLKKKQINPILFRYMSQPGCAVYFHMPTFWWKHAQENSNFKIKMWKACEVSLQSALFHLWSFRCPKTGKLGCEHGKQMEWWYLRVVVVNCCSPWFSVEFCCALKMSHFVWNSFGVEGPGRGKVQKGGRLTKHQELEHFGRTLKDWSNWENESYQKESQEHPVHRVKFSGRKRLFKLVERRAIRYSTWEVKKENIKLRIRSLFYLQV